LQEISTVSFRGSQEFSIACKDAFEGFLHAGSQSGPAKLLARHMDELLRAGGGSEGGGDASLESAVDQIMGLFRHLAAKDAFEAFFKKDLAKRLLQQRSSTASTGAEAFVLERLKAECGCGYTSKIEGMMKDIETSKATMSTFFSSGTPRQFEELGGAGFDAVVLTSGLWPTHPPSPERLALPGLAAQLQEMYAKFYAGQHTGRSLKWVPLLGQCALRARFNNEVRKELLVSHYQAMTLLLLNDTDRLTCQEVERATGIPRADVHRTLQSLSLHKTVKLLLKACKGREVDELETFMWNAGFTHKLYRITVTQIAAKDPQAEEAHVEQKLFEDRQHEVDAAIVRTMKAIGSLSHQELLAKVFSMLKFPATAADVKRQIESLIEREYLERDAVRNRYTYLA